MKIPLARPNIQQSDIDNVVNVLNSGMLVQGTNVQGLEDIIIKMLNTSYCSAVSNGTASLHIALISLGIGVGDEVIVPAFSYVATANVVELVGAKPVFVDIDIETFNIDISKINSKITERTKAIMPVHEFGLACNMTEIVEIAKKNNLYIIEDAACALGATWQGKNVGTFGDFGSFSLHPRKAVTSGEGGLLFSQNESRDNEIKCLRNHGIEHGTFPMNFKSAGFNYRMTDFQAALVFGQVTRLSIIIEQRQAIAKIYNDELRNSLFIKPQVNIGSSHIYQSYHILLESQDTRKEFSKYLLSKGITNNYGAQCIPKMTFYKNKYKHNCEIEFPNALAAYSRGLAIPLFETLTETEINYIINTINTY